jgi:gamma-glutamyl-gamma-aminobutyrate hydrolase PuuD
MESVAVEVGGRGWELGVQWHPEKWASRESDLLFRHFVAACEAARGR